MSGTARTSSEVRDAVASYAAEVRRHLDGLTPEQVEDLTDGLAADLMEALEDRGGTDLGGRPVDLAALFGPPPAYAAELRVAAGLPAGAGTAGTRGWSPRQRALAARARAAAVRAGAAVRRQPWAPAVTGLVSDVRPLWWVVRAWIAYQVVMWAQSGADGFPAFVVVERDGVPSFRRNWLLLVVLVVLSVQWGRRRWLAGQLRWLSPAVTIAALLVSVPVGVFTYESRFYAAPEVRTQIVEVPVAAAQQDGVYVDGMQVSNLFVYDAQGNALSDVQVYDDRGRAVSTVGGNDIQQWALPGVDELWTFFPAADEDGRDRWNVYPLLGVPEDAVSFTGDPAEDRYGLRLAPGQEPRVPPRPFAQAPALVDRAPAAESGTTATGDLGPGPTAAPPQPGAVDPTP